MGPSARHSASIRKACGLSHNDLGSNLDCNQLPTKGDCER